MLCCSELTVIKDTLATWPFFRKEQTTFSFQVFRGRTIFIRFDSMCNTHTVDYNPPHSHRSIVHHLLPSIIFKVLKALRASRLDFFQLWFQSSEDTSFFSSFSYFAYNLKLLIWQFCIGRWHTSWFWTTFMAFIDEGTAATFVSKKQSSWPMDSCHRLTRRVLLEIKFKWKFSRVKSILSLRYNFQVTATETKGGEMKKWSEKCHFDEF